MTDEEKKAIEIFKEENNKDLSRFDDFNSYTQFKVKRDKLIIDLIEKQQKEIEESIRNKFVSKDKIKAKIEVLKEDIQYSANPLSIDNSKFGIEVLQSLLTEKE